VPSGTYGGEVPDSRVTLFLSGDVMTGRGVDQILPRPGSPDLWEASVGDARTYVDLAESASGSVSRPADFGYPWGAALRVLDEVAPDARLINLETAVTGRGRHVPGKGIHYRMHPDNLPCLTAARLDVCALANNHVLDFGPEGLADTVTCLADVDIRSAGAGLDADAAWAPARLDLHGGGRLLVWSVATDSSGVPPGWAAAHDRPGVAYLAQVSERSADALAARIRDEARPGDLTVVSVHWGSNWGYEVFPEQVEFAHRLVDAGVHLVHGHSAHHPRPLEVYRGRLILYGCGDLLDDYEGIGGYEAYRPELRLMYFPTYDPDRGALQDLRMAVMRMRRMRLEWAAPRDAEWLADLLGRVSRPFGTSVQPADGYLRLGRD
jgi:poly-gamma-glutamate capsule biosynthesis protein CapA/YwtB (metallophosphatase superfamily)